MARFSNFKGGGMGGGKPWCYTTKYGYGHEFKSLVNVDDHNMETEEWGCVLKIKKWIASAWCNFVLLMSFKV
jgi:hypothetical protein